MRIVDCGMQNDSERLKKLVIARSEATWQSHEIASLRSQ